MSTHWLLGRAASVPVDDDWLGVEERAVLARLRIAKRRADWRLGRYLAKTTLRLLGESNRLDRIQVLADDDGVPRAFIDCQRSKFELSISHRAGIGLCVASLNRVGCDLERVEVRSERFVDDFFTARERARIVKSPPTLREREIALTWSAKESVLKLLQVGLRRDTRSIEVEVETNGSDAWQRFTATAERDRLSLRGWWRVEGEMVLTVVADGNEMPLALALA